MLILSDMWLPDIVSYCRGWLFALPIFFFCREAFKFCVVPFIVILRIKNGASGYDLNAWLHFFSCSFRGKASYSIDFDLLLFDFSGM